MGRAAGQVGSFDAARLVASAGVLAPDMRPSVVAVDMPLSQRPIISRRPVDDQVSRVFGAHRCSTHSPSARRPGLLAATICDAFPAQGAPLRTSECAGSRTPALLEVYPHTALLAFTGAGYRVESKTSKTRTYWPGEPLPPRSSFSRQALQYPGRETSATRTSAGTLRPHSQQVRSASRSAARIRRSSASVDSPM